MDFSPLFSPPHSSPHSCILILAVTNSQKKQILLYTVILRSKYSRALTPENFCQVTRRERAAVHTRAGGGAGGERGGGVAEGFRRRSLC
jgi:hypothetical protein